MIPPGHTQETSSLSASSSAGYRVSKYSLLAILYFFFNSVLLPKGLLYTTLMAPFMYLRQLQAGRQVWWKGFFGVLFIFDVAHLIGGVDLRSFLLSNALLVMVYFFTVSLWHFIRGYARLKTIFRQLLLVNAAFIFLALVFYFLPRGYRDIFWYVNKLTEGLEQFPRLSLMTYEASYYALLMLPVCAYYFARVLFGDPVMNRKATLVLASLPLLLSLSFGVLGSVFLSLVIMGLVHIGKLTRFRRPFTIAAVSIVLLLVTGLVLWWQFPANPLFIRLENILTGHDTSAKGRTTDSFWIAWQVAKEKSVLFGVGLGQVKIVSHDIVYRFYNYWESRYDIPNAVAETLAVFGILGVGIRLTLQAWLFYRCRVFHNYYSLFLFLFVFIYQFTGSYITSTVEYGIWVLAFASPFRDFDVKPRSSQGAHHETEG